MCTLRIGLCATVALLLSSLSINTTLAGETDSFETVSGSAAYRQRIAMPPEAVLTVRVEDVSRADAPALLLAETHEPFAGRQVPIPFLLKVPSTSIDPRFSYAVRATISINRKMLFTTTRSYPVLTRGATSKVDLLLEEVQPPQAQVPDLRNTDQTAVTYAGTLPCADCEGQYIVLTLFPDSTFRIRTSYLGNRSDTGQDFYDLGRWNYPENNADRILLRGAGKVPLQLNRLPDGTLRQLDQSGQPIVSQLNYELKRQQTIDMVAGPMQLRGMYLYLADAANLVECQTGKRLPILMVVDHAELERAYLAGRRHPGDEMLVSLVARFVEQAPEPGLPLREHLVVEKFERAMPGENCAATAQKPPPRLTTF